METAWLIIKIYVLLGLAAPLVMFMIFVYEDYFKSGSGIEDHKFGYHMRGRNGRLEGVSVLVLLMVMCPIINLMFGGWWFRCAIEMWWRKFRKKNDNGRT